MYYSRKNPYFPSEGVFWFDPHPSGNSSLGLYIALKNLAFEFPYPSEFPMTLCGRVWIFSGTTQCRRVVGDTFLKLHQSGIYKSYRAQVFLK